MGEVQSKLPGGEVQSKLPGEEVQWKLPEGEVHSKEAMHVFSVIQNRKQGVVTIKEMNQSQFVNIGSVSLHNTREGLVLINIKYPSVWGSFCAFCGKRTIKTPLNIPAFHTKSSKW